MSHTQYLEENVFLSSIFIRLLLLTVWGNSHITITKETMITLDNEIEYIDNDLNYKNNVKKMIKNIFLPIENNFMKKMGRLFSRKIQFYKKSIINMLMQ